MSALRLRRTVECARIAVVASVLVLTAMASMSTDNKRTMDFLLPMLPSTNYILNDVLVLPRNVEAVNVTVVDADGRRENRVEANTGTDFRIQIEEPISRYTEYYLRVPADSIVAINLTGSLVLLEATQTFTRVHKLITHGDKLENTDTLTLLILPAFPNTTTNICPFVRIKKNLNANSTFLSRLIPDAIKCRQVEVGRDDGFVLNNVSLLRGMEIIADKPVGILMGWRSNLSSASGADLAAGTAPQPISPLIWGSARHLLDSFGNQFLLLSSSEVPAFNLSILSLSGCNITLSGQREVLHYTADPGEPLVINNLTSPSDGWYMETSGLANVRYTTISGHTRHIGRSIVAINLDRPDRAACNDSTDGFVFQWLPLQADLSLLVICVCAGNVSLISKTRESITPSRSFVMNPINDTMYHVYAYTTPYNSVGKLSFNSHHCEYTLPIETNTPTAGSETVVPHFLKHSGDLRPVTGVPATSMQPREAPRVPSAPRRDALAMNHDFTMVLDILHSDDGQQFRLDQPADSPGNIDTGYRILPSQGQLGEDGGVMAVVASLLAALAAVALLILAFAVGDALSHRRHGRNTRIRPFISFY
ncbi:uncharacterized protein LOC128232951 [Mya arenaria]|uniref:uncharacterized protein LOC128232951 n=1 Tax=Mya arenaria TaxID=6604 RepID=UPI0022E4CCAE|nr:uncharacterized protein LOC128232951 [Mya arenaria]